MKRVWRAGDDSSPSLGGQEVDEGGRVIADVVGCGWGCGVKALDKGKAFSVVMDIKDDGKDFACDDADGVLQSSAW